MNETRKNTHHAKIVPTKALRVKGLIYAAGIKRLADLAKAAGMPLSTLSDQVSGRRRGFESQVRIVRAFNQITGQELSAAKFWGGLLGEEAA